MDEPVRRGGWLGRGVRVALGSALMTALVGCDHATKVVAKAALEGQGGLPVVDGVVELRYAQNPDIAFSAFRLLGVRPPPGVLAAGASVVLMLVAIMWIASRRKLSLVQHFGFAMVAAGAVGNVVDRLARGYVVDFIHVTRWPIFNVADVVIVLGVLLLAFGGSLGGRTKTAGAHASEPPPPPPSGPAMQPW